MQQVTANYVEPSGPGQVVAYTGTHGVITDFLPGSCSAVWVFCTSAAYVKVGVSPVATSADFPLPANVPVIIPLDTNNGNLKISAVQDTAAGNLHVCPVGY
jgi:hypothetical protein